MKKVFNNLSLIEFEHKVNDMNFNRWYYDHEKQEGLVILNKEETK